jgi:hypothetical protein
LGTPEAEAEAWEATAWASERSGCVTRPGDQRRQRKEHEDERRKTSQPGHTVMVQVVFSGDLEPNDPAAAALALARHGFEVTLLAERYRPLLAHPRDYFIEASKNVAAAGDDLMELADDMEGEVTALVGRYGGDVAECGLAEPNFVPFSAFRARLI